MALLFRRVILVLVICAVIFGSECDAKRRGRRRRPGRKLRGPPGSAPLRPIAQESRSVFYYDVPPARTERPRIILGDELDFSSLGISRPRQRGPPRSRHPKQHQSQSSYSLSALEQSYAGEDDNSYYPEQDRERPPRYNNALPPPLRDYDDYPPEPVREQARGPPKPPLKRGRSRGPGYRLERPWHEHYLLTGNKHGIRAKKPTSPAVYPYIRQAGKSLAGAYKAAIIQSAKMAKYTGSAASKYIMGIRNLVGGNRDLGRSSDDIEVQASTQSKDHAAMDEVFVKSELPEGLQSEDVVEIDLTKEATENGVLPKVYLDWGGSFWRFFYNKQNDIPAKSSEE